MPSFGMEKPWPDAGDEEDQLVDLGHLLGPRGNARLTPEDWAVAAQELDIGPLPQPAIAGMWQGGVSPVERARQAHRVWKEAAQRVANARGGAEVINTSDSVKPVRDGS